MKLILAILVLFGSTSPLLSEEIETYRKPGYSSTRTCTRREYREEYIPGTPENPGYVKNWYEYVEVSCNPNKSEVIDDNDCKEGSLIGGLLGAGLAASSSRGKGRMWAIPAGGVTGALIGCQIDGG
ncbi:glycine zipper 2TM domain-containing protein [Prochlorococcus sp. MIT 1223]|uniref:glycine zipper 2TM domain-containing protein n=1 Tax=Prochlorococcus sp. MIT 1223 TaxID=3096217 RepID=UPI002A75848F|nr:glycine zipper 2TM domain-containing protein [Prochlorococcus sp. MIT 1223]